MAHILVTGANGQLGSEMRALAAQHTQHQYLFNDRDELDLTDAAAVEACFAHFKPDYCVNCAAYTAVDKAETDFETAMQINAGAAKNLAEACRKWNAKFIHISTDYVFDGKASEPYKEDDQPAPAGAYGRTKWEGEKAVQATLPDAIIIRTSWVYSEWGNNFVKTMLRLMQSKKELGVVADQWGAPTYAADLAEAIFHIINSSIWEGGIYHYCNSGPINWQQFASAIQQYSGADCIVKPITTADYPTPAVRPAYSVMQTEKIEKVYGIQIKDWKESLQRCMKRLNALKA